MSRFLRAGLLAATLSLVALSALPVHAQTWGQVWSDEFNWNGGVDTGKWTFDVGGGGWGNNEAEYYTNNRWENARAELFSGSTNGRLIIEARKEPYGGMNYTSARMKSTFNTTYGRVQVKAKLPTGRGLWPAIWMLPNNNTYSSTYWPDNGEIDIMEQVGYDPNRIHGSVHTKWYNHNLGTQPTNSVIVGDATTDFKVYTLDWRPDKLEIFTGTDANPTQTRILLWEKQGRSWEAYPFNHSFFNVLNVAVGGSWGGSQGIDDTIFPRRMEVDYVRFYKMNSTPYSGTPINLPGRIEVENFDNGGEGYAFHDTDAVNNGGSYRSTPVDISAITDGYATQAIGWLNADEWLTYSVNLTQSKNYGFTIRTASPNSSKTFYIEVDDKRVTPDIVVPNTGSWNTYQSTGWTSVYLPAGQHKIRFVSPTGGFNVNWLDVW